MNDEDESRAGERASLYLVFSEGDSGPILNNRPTVNDTCTMHNRKA